LRETHVGPAGANGVAEFLEGKHADNLLALEENVQYIEQATQGVVAPVGRRTVPSSPPVLRDFLRMRLDSAIERHGIYIVWYKDGPIELLQRGRA
jgi:hypothetical protein